MDEQLVSKMVEHAIQALPASMEPTRVLMHPDDLAVVEKHLSEDFAGRKLSFISEASISRGGLKLMTATTDIDGTFETRWERVTASLDELDWQGLPNRKKTEAAAEDADEDTDKELETSEAIQDQVEAEL
jgi:flagellar biosynthesis/type III secretory pathway protein FliH